MTAPATHPRQRPSTAALAIWIGVFAVATVVGAYYDWYLWLPILGSSITILAGLAVVIAVVLWVTRVRVLRSAAAILFAIGAGLIAGQVVGPSRPGPTISEGEMRLQVDAPTAFGRGGPATCDTAGDGQVQVAADVNKFGRIPGSTDDIIGASISVGDMWDYGDHGARDDHVRVWLSIDPAIVPADESPVGTVYISDPASQVSARVDGADGRIEFADLALADPATGRPTGERSPLRGAIEWTCPGVAALHH